MQYLSSTKNLPWLTNMITLAFFSLSLVIKSGYSLGALILLITSLLGLPWWWKKRQFNKKDYLIGASFVFMASIGIFKAWTIDSSGPEYDIPVKFLITPLILGYLTVYPPKPSYIWWGVSLGAMGAGLSAIVYTWFLPGLLPVEHAGRASRYSNPIQYGNISILLAILSLCGLIALPKQQYYLKLSLTLGTAFGILAAVLSLSRGSWITLLLVLLILLILNFNKRRYLNYQSLITASIIAVVLGIGYMSLGEKINKRVTLATQNIINYYTKGNNTTSVGQRLSMWKFALHEGRQYPILGADAKQIKIDKANWVKAGNAPKIILKYTHLHNEYLDAFATKGLIGLLALLLLFGLPLHYYLTSLSTHIKNHPELRRLRSAGIAHISCFAFFGLTEVSLPSHNIAFLMLTLPLCMIYTCYCRELKQASTI
ncbi:MAG: O-antigen ligase family protein [Ostreibacterium sp.]